jgi:hypothetical protein
MDSADPRMITLRTGVTVDAKTAVAIWVNIQALHQKDWTALYDAVLLARDPGYVPEADSVRMMRAWGLLGGSGLMHDWTRAVLLAATEGDGADMTLRPPYASRGDSDG